MMNRIPCYTAITFILLLISFQVSESQSLSPADVTSLAAVSSVEMSRDASRIAYTLSVPRTEDDEIGRNYSELYIIPSSGGTPIPVLEKPNSAGSPQWGADGRLYFTARLTDHNNQTQVYSVNRSGADLQKHTDAEYGLSTFSWSDDGSHIAYTVTDPVTAERREAESKGFDMIVAGENLRYNRLMVQPRDGNAARVSPDDVHVLDFSWAPGGNRIALRVSDEPGADNDQLYSSYVMINRDGSDLKTLLDEPKKKAAMSWSPDGTRLAVLAGKVYSDPLPQRLWVIDTDNAAARDITPGNWEGTPEWVKWMDNSTLMFSAVERSSTFLYTLRTDRQTPNRIAGGGEEIFRRVSTDLSNRSFAASVNTGDHPGEVYVGDVRRGELRRLTQHNDWLSGRSLGEQSSITWNGADGIEIEGVLTLPVGYESGNRYPLIILPHGGPEGISLNGWTTRALYPVQVLAGNGYMVLEPNYRGSGGRGTEFASANHRDLGGKEFDDVLLAIDYLDQSGMIDPETGGNLGYIIRRILLSLGSYPVQ
jgi:dipeptidyl aminopeptidase/acylaminoacyl peptidase